MNEGWDILRLAFALGGLLSFFFVIVAALAAQKNAALAFIAAGMLCLFGVWVKGLPVPQPTGTPQAAERHP